MRMLRCTLMATLAAGCGGRAVAPAGPALHRDAFNRAAQAADLPLFWRGDATGDGVPQAAEVAVVWSERGMDRAAYFDGDAPTPAFEAALATIGSPPVPWAATPAEARRAERLRADLAVGRPTLIEEDLGDATPAERAMLGHLMEAALGIERLYARQKGIDTFDEALRAADPLSRAVFRRNQGPWCEAPGLDADADCNALAARPPRRSGLYPAALQADAGFCQALSARPDARTLLDPFSVVVAGPEGALAARPYTEIYGDDMAKVAASLDAAAVALAAEASEAPLAKYLTDAAAAFRTGAWYAADESWAVMNALNSRWYVRVGPDETYFEPCNEKAAFHLTLARIDQGSLIWQSKLDPLKNDMEQALAALAGAPYVARVVDFHLPDFIHIVLNAGDDRAAFGATVGESLPNWGPVANEGRGRTVAMTNLYTDADSRASFRGQAASVLCVGTMGHFSGDDVFDVLGTVLHEAAHNLGPSAEYAVDGKSDSAAFGGSLAAMLEELKAQTASLYLTDWIAARGVIDQDTAMRAHLRNLLWAMGQVSNGMYAGDGHAEPYPQLASVQLGALVEAGAVVWRADEKAANGTDLGCFEVEFGKLPPAVEALMRRVAQVKAQGDRAGAEAMKAAYVDAKDAYARVRDIVTERWRRVPKATFLYSVSVSP